MRVLNVEELTAVNGGSQTVDTLFGALTASKYIVVSSAVAGGIGGFIVGSVTAYHFAAILGAHIYVAYAAGIIGGILGVKAGADMLADFNVNWYTQMKNL